MKKTIIPRTTEEGSDCIIFRFISAETFGWRLDYWRRDENGTDHPSYRPILTAGGRRIAWDARLPTGQEAIDAASAILGRALTGQEETLILDLPVKHIP